MEPSKRLKDYNSNGKPKISNAGIILLSDSGVPYDPKNELRFSCVLLYIDTDELNGTYGNQFNQKTSFKMSDSNGQLICSGTDSPFLSWYLLSEDEKVYRGSLCCVECEFGNADFPGGKGDYTQPNPKRFGLEKLNESVTLEFFWGEPNGFADYQIEVSEIKLTYPKECIVFGYQLGNQSRMTISKWITKLNGLKENGNSPYPNIDTLIFHPDQGTC